MKVSKPSDLLVLGRSLKQVQYKHHRVLDARLGAIGISLTQWDALRAIAQSPDLSGHALAQATFQTDQAFSTLAQRLVQRGWVERIDGPGRAIRHRLTPQGEAMLQKGFEPVDAALEESFAGLSRADRLELQALLQRILDGK